MNNQQIEANKEQRPTDVASGAVLGDTQISDALKLVDVGPQKSVEWIEAITPMCKWCERGEDVDQAAARILAKEVRRLLSENKALIKNLNVCEQKAEEILEHTTGGERTKQCALIIRTAAVQHDLSPNDRA